MTLPEKCECGALFVYINGQRWCAQTRARYIALYGIPESERKSSSPPTSSEQRSTIGD